MSLGHVVLVGLPGAGKSTVGPLVARALGRPFVDLDAELERRAGRTVAEQFARDGEAAFRRAEAALSGELAAAEPAVLAAGGGWAANVEARRALAGAQERVYQLVYLQVSADVAAARLVATPGERARRPLLAGAADPAAAVAALLARREAVYAEADLVIDAAVGPPDAVAERVVTAVRAGEVAGV